MSFFPPSFWDLQIECRPVTQLALSPRFSSHPFHRFTHNRQSDACTWIFLRPVESLKDIEDAILVLHIKTHSVITYPEPAILRRLICTDLYVRLRAAFRELD